MCFKKHINDLDTWQDKSALKGMMMCIKEHPLLGFTSGFVYHCNLSPVGSSAGQGYTWVTFGCNLTADQDQRLLETYFAGQPPADQRGRMIMYKMLCDLLWTLWGIVQHANGNPAEDFWAYAVAFSALSATDGHVRISVPPQDGLTRPVQSFQMALIAMPDLPSCSRARCRRMTWSSGLSFASAS